MGFYTLDSERTILFFDSVAASNSVSVCLCGFPLCFQSALQLALVLMLLSCVDHLVLSFLPLPWREGLWLQHGGTILAGGMSTSRPAGVCC